MIATLRRVSPDKQVLRAARALSQRLSRQIFAAPVTHVYDPHTYALRPYAQYVQRYAHTPKRIVYLGMNPGPFGMAQTGIPFGEINAVRDWMGIDARVDKPVREHPKRPIEGFACTRSEVSGARLWGAFAARHGAAERFFSERFVANYCPLVFMEHSGRNRTPDKLAANERERLYAACDEHLRALVKALSPAWVIGVGAFAKARAAEALAGLPVQVGSILHPSPASPAANRDWVGQAARQMADLGLAL